MPAVDGGSWEVFGMSFSDFVDSGIDMGNGAMEAMGLGGQEVEEPALEEEEASFEATGAGSGGGQDVAEPPVDAASDDDGGGGWLDAGLDLAQDVWQTADEFDQAVNPMRWARDAASERAGEAAQAVIDAGSAWLFKKKPDAEETEQTEEGNEQELPIRGEDGPADTAGEQDHPSMEQPPASDIVFEVSAGRNCPGEGDARKVQPNPYATRPRRYDPTTHSTMRGDLPIGLKVNIVHDTTLEWSKEMDGEMYVEFRAYAQIVTLPDQEVTITEADNFWTRMDYLSTSGFGEEVTLGDESTEEGKEAADALREELPEGRSPGSSDSSWSTSHIFALSADGATLDGDLYSRVCQMLTWAIDNDMLVGEAIMTDGVRSPKVAHRLSVAYNIIHHPEITSFDAVKALPGGTDADGNVWYEEGDTYDDVKKRARKVRDSSAPAAEGYADAAAAAPNPGGLYVSNHTTGKAIDCFIPWRKAGVDASTNQRDPAGWEHLYNRFGLCRPVSGEDWHIELLGKPAGGEEDQAVQ